jgi:hypothetical protein
MTKQEFREKQEILGQIIRDADEFAEVKNEKIVKKINNKKGANIRAREDRISIKVVYNHECDLTDQSDAELYSMNTIYNKLKTGQPVLPSAIRKDGVYVKDSVDIEDLTDLYNKNEAYMRKYGKDLNAVYEEIIGSVESDNENTETVTSEITETDNVSTKQPASDEGA